jgi:hypothetical protein
MKTAKVIDIFTKKEVTQVPYASKDAQDIMEYIIKYKNPRTEKEASKEEMAIVDTLLYFLENNSGTLREDLMERGA